MCTQYKMINFTIHIILLCIGWEKYTSFNGTTKLFGDSEVDSRPKPDFCG